MPSESIRKEEIKQVLLVVGSVLALFMLITGIALFFNRSSGSPLATPPSKRFAAKSGTTRNRAVALISRKQTARSGDTSSGAQNPESRGETQRRIRARMLSEIEETRPLTETQRKIREALNTLDPDEGLRKLQSLLDLTRDDRERSDIYAAMSELYLQQDTPDLVSAENMLDAALSAAPDAETRARMLLRQAELCAARGAPQLALAKIQVELRRLGAGADPAATLPLMTAQGFLQEMHGSLDEAETSYRQVLQLAGAASTSDATESVRDAGMRLTRLLRDRQRDAEADQVARQVAVLTGNSMAKLIPSPTQPGTAGGDNSPPLGPETAEPSPQGI